MLKDLETKAFQRVKKIVEAVTAIDEVLTIIKSNYDYTGPGGEFLLLGEKLLDMHLVALFKDRRF